MKDQPKRGRGRPRNGFDKKAYDREYHRKRRLATLTPSKANLPTPLKVKTDE